LEPRISPNQLSLEKERELIQMLSWTLLFLVIAMITGIFGFWVITDWPPGSLMYVIELIPVRRKKGEEREEENG
jgi:hypothetical protein